MHSNPTFGLLLKQSIKKQEPRKAVGCFRMKESYLSILLNAWAPNKNIIKWKQLVLVSRSRQGISQPTFSLMGEETMMLFLNDRRKAAISAWSEILGALSKDAFTEMSCCAEPRALWAAELLSTGWHLCSISETLLYAPKF